jgi:hypothetical protein
MAAVAASLGVATLQPQDVVDGAPEARFTQRLKERFEWLRPGRTATTLRLTAEMTISWKLDRKAELMALLRVMQKDENVLLRHKLRTQAVQMAAPELAKIIAQGIEEGVFKTAFVLTLAKVPPRLAGEIEPEGRIQCINKRACNLRKGLTPPS